MKNSLKISVVALSSVLLLSGCIEETFPEGGSVTAGQVSESPTALKAMVNAIPVAMMKANTAGYVTKYGVHTDFGLPAMHIMTENMLEDVATLGDNPYYNRFYSFALNDGMGERYISCAYFWDCYYAWVKNCNDVISLITPETANPETIIYLGQAYAYRAMCYLDMARLFEPKENKYTNVKPVLGLTVPIVTEKTTEADGKNNPRATHDAMYAFILEDLQKAATYLEKATTGYTAPTLAAVYGLYARTYLEMGAAGDAEGYTKAAEYARKAITTSGCTPLTEAQWEDPQNGFNKGSANKAWIWGLTLAAEQSGNLFHFNAHMCTEATWGYAANGLAQIGVNKRFYEQMSDKDFRKHSWLDPERDAYYTYKINGDRAKFLAGARDYQSLKFRPAQGETADYAVGGCADHPIMRVEEMYFIEIEATAHTNLGAAQDLLNSFMQNRITDKSYDCKSKTAGLNDFLTEMLLQKRIEFWGEGVLVFDYKRLNAGITRGYRGTNHPGIYCFNTDGRSPAWNVVITRGESQGNTAITTSNNNPDPSGTITQWIDK